MNRTSLFLIFSLFSLPLSALSSSEAASAPWGCEADLAEITEQLIKNKGVDKGIVLSDRVEAGEPRFPIGAHVGVSCIRFFQRYISPIDGPRSSFYPTSSQYALEAINRYGVLMGIALGCDRLMRENSEEWVYDVIDKHGQVRKYDPVR